VSSTTPPPRRRRIAGESARPGAQRSTGKPVAKKPAPTRGSKQKQVEPAQPPIQKKPVGPEQKPASKPVVRTASRPSAPSGVSWREIATLIVAAALLVGGIVVSVLGYQHWHADSFGDSRTTAVKSASESAETILSYRYDKLDEHEDAVKQVMTTKYFEDEYVKVTAPSLEELAPQRKVTIDAKVRNAAVVPCGEKCSANEAKVLLFIDLDRRLGDETTATVFGNRVVLDMVKVNGDWKVSDVTGL